jgi:membrane protein DedA with SNARE-associated domain
MLELVTDLLEFLRRYPESAAVVVFALGLVEALPFSWILIVSVGSVVCAAGAVPCWIVTGLTAAGIAISDWFLYWLGQRYRERVLGLWPLRNRPDLVATGQNLFRRWGIWAVALSRVSGPARASVPIVAGLSSMPFIPFQLANWASALVMAALLLSPGALYEAVSSATP